MNDNPFLVWYETKVASFPISIIIMFEDCTKICKNFIISRNLKMSKICHVTILSYLKLFDHEIYGKL